MGVFPFWGLWVKIRDKEKKGGVGFFPYERILPPGLGGIEGGKPLRLSSKRGEEKLRHTKPQRQGLVSPFLPS